LRITLVMRLTCRLIVLAAVGIGVAACSGRDAAAQTDQDATIQQVIQQADQEQAQAVANQDASGMADTATADHYQELQQLNQQLLDSGVTSISLDGIEWGPINVTGSQATATDFETWTTISSDASTLESRDENDYTLVQQNGTWLIASDAQPSGTSRSQFAAPTPRPTPQPTPGEPGATPTPGAMSRNWAGYAATGGMYSAVSGTWSIPAFSPSSSGGLNATWVGIGGINSTDLIQAGTQEQTSGTGQTLYSAWLEILPQPSQPVALVVRAGDSISVSLNEQSPGTWQVSLTNNTTGQSQQVTGQYDSSYSSAEWIEEAPSAGRGGPLPLDDFGTIAFSGASTLDGGQQVDLSQAGAQPIELDNADQQPLVTTSAIGSDGASFSVTRTSTPDSQPGNRSNGPGRG
jgi:hypothetical protein